MKINGESFLGFCLTLLRAGLAPQRSADWPRIYTTTCFSTPHMKCNCIQGAVYKARRLQMASVKCGWFFSWWRPLIACYVKWDFRGRALEANWSPASFPSHPSPPYPQPSPGSLPAPTVLPISTATPMVLSTSASFLYLTCRDPSPSRPPVSTPAPSLPSISTLAPITTISTPSSPSTLLHSILHLSHPSPP